MVYNAESILSILRTSYFASSFANSLQVKYQILKKNIVVIILTRKKLFELLLCIEQQHEAIIKVYGRMEADNHYHRHHYYPSWTTYLMLQHFSYCRVFFLLVLHLKVKKTTEIYWWYNAAKRLKCDKVVLNFTKKNGVTEKQIIFLS